MRKRTETCRKRGKKILTAAALVCVLSAGVSVMAEESAVAVGSATEGMTERASVDVDGNTVEVISAGDTTVDVVKEVVPHPLTPYQYSNAALYADGTESFSMMGKAYTQGVACVSYDSPRLAYYNLAGKCNHVSFEVGHIDGGSSNGATLNIYTDGSPAQTIELTSDMITQEVVVDTTGVTQLTLELTGKDAAYGFGNVSGYGYEYHNFKKEMTRMVSAVAEGAYTYTCTDCGYTFEEIIPSQNECEPYLLPYQSTVLYDLASTEDVTDCEYVMGEPVYKGLVFDSYDSYRDALYNLGQAYKSVTFTVGHIDNKSGGAVTLRVFADGMQMKEMELSYGMMSRQVTVDTTGVTQLKLTLEGKSAAYAVYDMKFEPLTEHGHSFTSEVVLEPAVGMTGICAYTCEYCGATYSEIIPALEG